MAEPTSTTSGVTIATGVITLTGSVLGLQWDALLLGLFGGLFALQHVAPFASRWHVASGLAMASLFGAAFAPFADSIAHASFVSSWISATPIPADAPRLAGALVFGMAAQFVVPMGFRWIKARMAKEGQS